MIYLQHYGRDVYFYIDAYVIPKGNVIKYLPQKCDNLIWSQGVVYLYTIFSMSNVFKSY